MYTKRKDNKAENLTYVGNALFYMSAPS